MFDRFRDFLCDALGWALFMPLAFLTHVIWGFYGTLAYFIALLGCDAKKIIEPYVLVVGPMYVSSKFFKSWLYSGCEPESADDPHRLRIDRTLALRFWAKNQDWWSENLRGNETKPVAPDTVIERKASGF